MKGGPNADLDVSSAEKKTEWGILFWAFLPAIMVLVAIAAVLLIQRK